MAEVEEVKKDTVAPEMQPNKKPSFKDKKGDRKPMRREDSEFDKRVVSVRRVQKVVKGGRTLRFSALVVVGDGKGKVGIALGKAKEVSLAIEKATTMAKKNMVKVPMVEGSIPHEVIGKFSSTKILLLPAPAGTGVIAGGSARAVIELAGIGNIVTKRHGSSNKINVVKATFEGLMGLKTKEEIARRRGKSVEEI